MDNLQRSNCHYGIFLPTLYATIASLKYHKQNKDLKYCAPLATSLLDGLCSRFAHILDFNSTSAKSAIIGTCTHLHFKQGWLGQNKSNANIEIIKNILLAAADKAKIPPKNDDRNKPKEAEASLTIISRLNRIYRNIIIFKNPFSY